MKNVPARNLQDRRYAPKVVQDKRLQAALDDCVRAIEEFGEDELERYAAK